MPWSLSTFKAAPISRALLLRLLFSSPSFFFFSSSLTSISFFLFVLSVITDWASVIFAFISSLVCFSFWSKTTNSLCKATLFWSSGSPALPFFISSSAAPSICFASSALPVGIAERPNLAWNSFLAAICSSAICFCITRVFSNNSFLSFRISISLSSVSSSTEFLKSSSCPESFSFLKVSNFCCPWFLRIAKPLANLCVCPILASIPMPFV